MNDILEFCTIVLMFDAMYVLLLLANRKSTVKTCSATYSEK